MEKCVTRVPLFFLVHRVIKALTLGSRVWPAPAVHLTKANPETGLPKVADGLGLRLAPLLLLALGIVGQEPAKRAQPGRQILQWMNTVFVNIFGVTAFER